MGPHFGWSGVSGVHQDRENSESQVDEDSNMALTISSVGGELSKGFKTSTRPDARHFSVSLYTAGALQAASSVLEPIGSKSG